MKLPSWIRSLWAILWRVLLFAILFGGVSAAIFLPMTSLEAWEALSPLHERLVADGAGLIAMLIATWIMTRFIDRRPFHTIGFAPQRLGRNVGIGLAAGSGWLLASVGVAWLSGMASPTDSVSMSAMLLILAGVSVLLNVITQQLLLCGYIFQTIRVRKSFLVTLLVSAVLFSAYHGAAFEGAWLPAVNVFLAGALFCLAYEVTGSLWLPIAIHFAWNFLLGPLFGLTVSGTDGLGIGWSVFDISGPDLLSGGAFGLEGGLIVTITTAVLIAFLATRWRR